MSVVIVGGHKRMECRYKRICEEYNCSARIFTECAGQLHGKLGSPDLIVLFTNPVSHTMAKAAKNKAAQNNILLVQSHCGSSASLRAILEQNRGS
jgi:hypothetical protein